MSPAWSEDAKVEASVKICGANAESGQHISLGAGETANEAFQAKASQVVGHGARGVGVQVPAEKGGDMTTKLGVSKAGGEVEEQTEGMEEGHDAKIGKTKGGGFLVPVAGGMLELVELAGFEEVGGESLRIQELQVGLVGEVAKLGKVFQALVEVEISGLVDGGFGSQSFFLFEVLLDMGIFVFQMEAGVDTNGDDAGAVSPGGRRCAGSATVGKQQADPVGSAQIEVFPDHLFKEIATRQGAVKDLGETDFQLPEAEPMAISGVAVLRL